MRQEKAVDKKLIRQLNSERDMREADIVADSVLRQVLGLTKPGIPRQ